jgi:hypothetical protein
VEWERTLATVEEFEREISAKRAELSALLDELGRAVEAKRAADVILREVRHANRQEPFDDIPKR